MDQNNESIFGSPFDQESVNYLTQAGKWAKFIAIVGFIFCILFVIIGLFAGTLISSSLGSLGAGASAIGAGAIAVIYIVIALLYVLPCIFLFRFGSKVQAAVRSNDLHAMNTSLKNLKSFFKYIGILVIIVLSIYALAAVGGMLFMGMMR
jgi:hypothetical protein